MPKKTSGFKLKILFTIISVVIFIITGLFFSSIESESKIESVFEDAGVHWPDDISRINEFEPIDSSKGDIVSFDIDCGLDGIEKILNVFDINDSHLINETEYCKSLKSNFEPEYPWLVKLKFDKSDKPSKRIHVTLLKAYD